MRRGEGTDGDIKDGPRLGGETGEVTKGERQGKDGKVGGLKVRIPVCLIVFRAKVPQEVSRRDT